MSSSHRRQFSGSPVSVYSVDSTETAPPKLEINNTAVAAPGVPGRRPSIQSDRNMDKRRVAIVEMDRSASHAAAARSSSIRGPRDPTSTASSPNNLLSRRGRDGRMHDLALVAPPDASPASYMNLTPPTTAPPDMRAATHRRSPDASMDTPPGHHRSTSEATPVLKKTAVRRKGSRDIGIVGLGMNMPPASESQTQTAAIPAIFQTPIISQTATPPSSAAQDIDATPTRLRFQPRHAPLTPEIGQQKDVQVPVAGPIVVGLSPGQSWFSGSDPNSQGSSPGSSFQGSPMIATPATHPSPYLHYQPGVHAIAGPLPPPPRAIFEINPNVPPPPRPPRMTSPPPKSPHRRRFDLPKPELTPALPTVVPAEANPDPPPLVRAFSDFSIAAMSSDDEWVPPHCLLVIARSLN